MLISAITINNLTVFSGKHKLDLQPSQNGGQPKPIVIVGGMNGTGKTTFFDAIKLCLYGQDVLPKSSAAKYQGYVKERIHNSKNTIFQPTSASVELDFQYSRVGEKTYYKVERLWEVHGNKINEHLTVTRNGQPVDDVEKSSWQEFVKELIPVGLSQLFFFDGEKIQKMMSDEDNVELKRSILSLFGLDLIERLQSDLKIYKTSVIKQQSDEGHRKDLQVHEQELALICAEIRHLEEQLEDIKGRTTKLSEDISAYESKMKAQGEDYIRNRDTLGDQKRALEEHLKSIRDRLEMLASGLLPITIACECSRKLKNQLLAEGEAKRGKIISEALRNKCEKILTTIDECSFLERLLPVSTPDGDRVKQLLRREIEELFSGPASLPIVEVHGLSERQTTTALQKLDEASTEVPLRLKQLTAEYEETYKRLHQIHLHLQRVPEDELIRPMYEKLAEMNRQLGGLENEQNRYNEKLKELTYKRNELQRKIDNLLVKLELVNKAHKNLALINKSEDVLSTYHAVLAKFKIAMLEREFAAIFNTLHRKTDQISRIEISPDTFDVYLFDRHGTKINKNILSSGELEIYAMSMVWALAKISGQKLPFMIDTPLARLDSDHRDNLIKVFFPHASHQMVIFSTNTEVDKGYFDSLRPYLSRSYSLEHDKLSGTTMIKEGYFWD